MTLIGNRRDSYLKSIHYVYDLLAEYQDIESFRQLTFGQQSKFLERCAIWYSETSPHGLRYENDHGPQIEPVKEVDYCPAIGLFWYKSLYKCQNEFKEELQKVIDSFQTSYIELCGSI